MADNGLPIGRSTTPIEDFEAFDRLPRGLQDAVRNASFPVATPTILDFYQKMSVSGRDYAEMLCLVLIEMTGKKIAKENPQFQSQPLEV